MYTRLALKIRANWTLPGPYFYHSSYGLVWDFLRRRNTVLIGLLGVVFDTYLPALLISHFRWKRKNLYTHLGSNFFRVGMAQSVERHPLDCVYFCVVPLTACCKIKVGNK